MVEKHATRVPTVLIGIGGIGGQIVRLVDRDLRQYDKQFVRMVVLDTNTNDLKKSKKVNIPLVQTSENMTVSDYLRQNRRFLEWFPTNPLINAKNLTQGAGQIRSVSRLGALASEDAHRFDTIRHAIEEVNRNVGNSLHNMIRVMIVGSVCGGTGSGMGIQLPFLVRDLVEEIAHMPRTIIRGLFIMPDVVEEVQDTDEKKKSVYVNGYAFLRELNAFNRAQMYKRGTEKLNIEHYHRDDSGLRDDPTKMSHQVPYDFLFLVEKSNINGQNIGGFDAYISKAAQIVKAQLFASDMTANLLSSEDNLIVSAVNKEGLNRFCGAGIARAIYPEEENLLYCTLRFTESILQGYWLRIDRQVNINMGQHKRLMATNPSLMPKDPKEEFISVFDKMTDPTQSEITAEMGQLKRDLEYRVEISNSDNQKVYETVNCAEELWKDIDSFVKGQYNSDERSAEGRACKMSAKKLNSNSAITYCNTQLERLRQYEKTAKERVGQLTAGTIDAILGADYVISQSYSDVKKYPYNICAAINSKHPIIARYILYYIRLQLESEILKGEAGIAEAKNRKTIFQKDYYQEKSKDGKKDNTIEDPSEALMRTKPGMLNAFGIQSAERNRLVSEIVKDANSFIQIVDTLSELNLKKEVYNNVLKRIDILISIYDEFFKELEQILYQNRRDIEVLEEAQDRIQNSDIYVCSDIHCKKWLYDKFENKLTGADNTLPDDIKHSFFDAIFKEYINKHKATEDSTSFTEAPLSMRALFESAILKPLTDKYKDNEMAHIRMDIISALKIEYQIHSKVGKLQVNGTIVDPIDYDFDQYFESTAEQLRELSTPYLSYSRITDAVNNMLIPNADVSDIALDPDDKAAATQLPTNGRILCYWGVNNTSAARHQHKKDTDDVDRNGLTRMFGDPDGATYFVVNDDSFDARQLVCYSSVYDLFIENLDKYRNNAKAYEEYKSRLLRVMKSDFNVGTGSSEYLDTVHPHLDRHWHAHAYLPMLRIDDEIEEQKQIAKAFLLGIACCRVWYMQLDHNACWAFRKTGERLPKPLTVQGEIARRSSFYTLFNAMDENTVAVNDIIRQASLEKNRMYNNARIGGIKPEDILKHSIIVGLIGDKYSEEDMADLETLFKNTYAVGGGAPARKPLNILKVIYSVYQDSYDLELVTQLLNNLTEYLNGYCLKMANKQKGAAEILFKSIAKAIGANFNTSDVDMQFIMLCDAYL